MFLNNKINIYFYSFFLIFLIHLISHFIPFERLSIAPDDYAHHAMIKDMNIYEIVSRWTDRPLHFIWASIIYKVIGYNAQLGTYIIFISSFIPTILAFLIFKKIFKSFLTSIILSIIYLLIPNKLEVFHTVVFIHINIVMSLYLTSILCFLLFIEKNKSIFLSISIFSYCIGIFWYEAGFFLPIIFFIVLSIKNNFLKSIKLTIPFILVGIFYLIFRYTNGFGIGDNYSGRLINLDSLFFISELFNSFFGRYMIRSIIYGLYNFINIPSTYLYFLIFLNLILTSILYYFLSINKENYLKKNTLYLALLLILIFLLPNMLSGKIGGRNLVIPAIGFSVFVYSFILLFKKYRNIIFLFFFIAGLTISQGNNWAQVVASRINYSILEKMNLDKNEILNSETIIINVDSFANNIPYTLVDNEFNILNTYYGAQALEDWGLTAMVAYISDYKKNKVYIAYSNPVKNNKNELEFLIKYKSEYRSTKLKKIKIQNKNIYILDFFKVYKNNFNYGKYKKSE